MGRPDASRLARLYPGNHEEMKPFTDSSNNQQTNARRSREANSDDDTRPAEALVLSASVGSGLRSHAPHVRLRLVTHSSAALGPDLNQAVANM